MDEELEATNNKKSEYFIGNEKKRRSITILFKYGDINMNKSKQQAENLYKIFKEHYQEAIRDPQTMIMQKANGTILKSPLFISWEITSNCNLSCIHCRAAYNNSRYAQSRKVEQFAGRR